MTTVTEDRLGGILGACSCSWREAVFSGGVVVGQARGLGDILGVAQPCDGIVASPIILRARAKVSEGSSEGACLHEP